THVVGPETPAIWWRWPRRVRPAVRRWSPPRWRRRPVWWWAKSHHYLHEYPEGISSDSVSPQWSMTSTRYATLRKPIHLGVVVAGSASNSPMTSAESAANPGPPRDRRLAFWK